MTPEERERAWVEGTQRMAELRDMEHRSAADEIELRTLWARFTPVMPPKMPRTYAASVDRVKALFDRLNAGGLSDEVDNRLRWNAADIVKYTTDQLASGEWTTGESNIFPMPFSGDGKTRYQ